MRKFSLFLIMAAGALTLSQLGHAQDAQTGKVQRSLYLLKHGSARDLADVLAKHFQGEPGMQVLAEPGSNGLLLTASPEVLKEMVELIGQLDRRPRMIQLEVFIADLPLKKADGAKEVKPKELTGTSAEVVGKLEALQKQGVIGELRRFQLNAVEKRPAAMQAGSNRPFVSGTAKGPFAGKAVGKGGKGGGGKAFGDDGISRTINYHPLGTKVEVTARVQGDTIIALDLVLNDSHIILDEAGVPTGTDEKGKPIPAAEFVTTTLKSKMNIQSGRAMAVEGVSSQSRTGQAQALVVISARILEDGPENK